MAEQIVIFEKSNFLQYSWELFYSIKKKEKLESRSTLSGLKHGVNVRRCERRLYSTGLLRRLTSFTFIVQHFQEETFQTKVVNKFKFDFDIFFLFPFYIFHGYKDLLITLRGNSNSKESIRVCSVKWVIHGAKVKSLALKG